MEEQIYYFKREPYFLKADRAMTDEEIKDELENIGEDKEIMYENNEPVGVMMLFNDKENE